MAGAGQLAGSVGEGQEDAARSGKRRIVCGNGTHTAGRVGTHPSLLRRSIHQILVAFFSNNKYEDLWLDSDAPEASK